MKHIVITIAAVVLVGCGEPQNDSLLIEASKKGNYEVVEQQLAAGASVKAKNHWGWTALHGATGGGHKKIAELLIAAGAGVNTMCNAVNTPLNLLEEVSETADLLRKHGGKTGKELKAEATK